MGGIIRRDMSISLLISLSYFLFWMMAIFIAGNGDMLLLRKEFFPFSWQILFVSFINIGLHHIAVPFIRTKKTKWYWISLSVLIIFLLLTIGYNFWFKLGHFFSVYPAPKALSNSPDTQVKSVIFHFFGLGYFASIKSFIDSYTLKSRNQQLSIEKKTAELSYLKSQTNPHFLFNTLNNIYLLCREKSDLAPESVLKLSALLRYMLYETNVELIPVETEIKILKDYIELEKMRYDDSLRIKFTIEADDIKQEIPPLLMLPLVENAFKHGVSETTKDPFISMQLTIRENRLRFNVENSVGSRHPEIVAKEGIGITNLRRQLGLMFKNADLHLESREHSFIAAIYINLETYGEN